VSLQLGDRGNCLSWLGKAVRAGYGTLPLRRSPELAPLRDDPEFMKLVGAG